MSPICIFLGIGLLFIKMQKVSTCGIQEIQPITDFRIVGGIEAIPHSWPWQVSLLNDFKEPLCGGSIIASQWILTAAHCFVLLNMTDLPMPTYVRVGEHNISPLVVEPHQKDIPILEVIIHPSYNVDIHDQDIAIIKLAEELHFNSHVSPLCLPNSSEEIKMLRICYTAGWGSTIPDMFSEDVIQHIFGNYIKKREIDYVERSKILLQLAVPVIPSENCKNIKYLGPYITNNMICGGSVQGKDACDGDSGGPLVCKDSINRWIQYGIVSWGIGCATPNIPAFYTKVSNYISWINGYIALN